MRRALMMSVGAALLLPAPLAAQERKPEVSMDGHRLKTVQRLRFASGATVPDRASDAAIASVANWMREKTFISALRIEGHAASGSANAQAVSEARALAVAERLVTMGVECKRLIVVGFGDTKPLARRGDAANERIEFVNAALRGRAIGGLPLDGGGKSAGDACALPKAR